MKREKGPNLGHRECKVSGDISRFLRHLSIKWKLKRRAIGDTREAEREKRETQKRERQRERQKREREGSRSEMGSGWTFQSHETGSECSRGGLGHYCQHISDSHLWFVECF